MWDWAVSSDCMIKWWNPAVQIMALLPLLFLFLPLIFLLLNHLSLWDVRCLCFSHGINVRATGFCQFRRVGMPSFCNRYSNPKFGKLSRKHPLQSDRTRTSRCASFKICTMQPSLGAYSLGIPMTQGINIGYGARELGRPCGFWMLLLCVLLHAYVPTWLVA